MGDGSWERRADGEDQWGGVSKGEKPVEERENMGVGSMNEQPMEKVDQRVNGMERWAIR